MEPSLLSDSGGFGANRDLEMRDPLGFLVGFVTKDLPTLTRREWDVLEWDLAPFLCQGHNIGPVRLWFSPTDIYDYRGPDAKPKFQELQR